MTTNDATPREADRAVPEPDADAVERVAKALCDFDVESNGGYRWEDRSDEWGSDYEYGRNHYRDMARAALAAAADATATDADTVARLRRAAADELKEGNVVNGLNLWARAARAALAAVPVPDADIAEVHRSAYSLGVNNGYVTGLDSARKYIATMSAPLDKYEISHAIGKEIRSYKRDLEAGPVQAAAGDDLDSIEWDELHVANDLDRFYLELEGVPDERGKRVIYAQGDSFAAVIADAMTQANARKEATP